MLSVAGNMGGTFGVEIGVAAVLYCLLHGVPVLWVILAPESL